MQDNAQANAQANAQSFVDTLMSAEFEINPNCDKINILRIIPNLETRRKGSTGIIVRAVTVPFWKACIDKVDTPNKCYRVAAVGTPGIGKTTTTPILIRMLLEQKKTVVYLIRTQKERGWHYEFTPSINDNKVTANVYPESADTETIISLTKEETYYIVDPGLTKDSCNPPTSFFPKVIIVTSPDESHWGGSEFTKGRGNVAGYFKIHPIWSLDELLAVRHEFGDFSEEKIRDRYRTFGGVPRRVFAGDIEVYLGLLETAIEALSPGQVEKIALGRVDALGDFGANAPKGILLAFEPANETDFALKYLHSQLLSPVIREKICQRHMTHLWDIMLRGSDIIFRGLFEPYVRYLIQSESGCVDLECRPLLPNAETIKMTIPRCPTIRLVSDPALFLNEVVANTLLHSSVENYALIDCIFKDKHNQIHAIQVTTGKNHKIDSTKMNELYHKVIGTETSNGEKIRLYYIVPSKNFPTFKTDPVSPRIDPEKFDVYVVSIPDPNAESRTVALDPN